MAEIKIRKRERTNGGAVYEYRFEIASVNDSANGLVKAVIRQKAKRDRQDGKLKTNMKTSGML